MSLLNALMGVDGDGRGGSPAPMFQQAYDLADDVIGRLTDIHAAIEKQERRAEMRRVFDTVIADGAGAGQISLRVPAGFEWEVQRFGVVVESPGVDRLNGQVYLDTVNPGMLVEALPLSNTWSNTPNGIAYTDAFADNVYVNENRSLLLDFNAAIPAAVVTLSLQVRQFGRLPLERTHSYDLASA